MDPLRDLHLTALEWKADYAKAKADPELRSIYDDVLDERVEEIAYKDEAKAETFRKVVKAETISTDHFCERWVTNSSDSAKSKKMKVADLSRLSKEFPYTHQITRQALREWILRLQNEDGLKPATIQRIFSGYRSYWDFLQRIGQISEDNNPFERVTPERTQKTKASREAERKAFTTEQVVTLLSGAIDKGDLSLARLIWLGMWTGCRIKELCALQVPNVGRDRFTVVDSKSPAGERVIPIHPALSDLIEHLTQNSSDGYVISGLTFNMFGDRSNAIGKRFGSLRTKLGFGPQYVFHSIRKTVVTEFQNAGIEEVLAANIIGHKIYTMTYGTYSGGAYFDVKKRAIEKIQYPIVGTPSFLLL